MRKVCPKSFATVEVPFGKTPANRLLNANPAKNRKRKKTGLKLGGDWGGETEQRRIPPAMGSRKITISLKRFRGGAEGRKRRFGTIKSYENWLGNSGENLD